MSSSAEILATEVDLFPVVEETLPPVGEVALAAVMVDQTTQPSSAGDVQAAQGGDMDAFARLVVGTLDDSLGLAFGVCGNSADAQEVVQDSYLRALRSLGQFRGSAEFSVWFYRIVKNTALNLVERRRWLDPTPFGEDTHDDAINRQAQRITAQDEAQSIEFRVDLQEALQELTPARRAVVVLFDVMGYDHETIQEKFGYKNSKVLLHRGRKQLRKILYPLPGE